MTTVSFTGCAVGLTNDDGLPIRKTWRAATNDPHLLNALSGHGCPGAVEHPTHQRVEGKYTKLSELYTDKMVRIIHSAWKHSVRRRTRSGKITLDKLLRATDLNGQTIVHHKDEKVNVPCMPVEAGTQEHRPKKLPRSHPFNALVVRSVVKTEMLATPKALEAMDIEYNKLRQQGVWDESTVAEYDDVVREARRLGKTAHFGEIFGVCGEKESELPQSAAGRLLDKNTIEQCDIHVCSLFNVAQRSGALGSTHYSNQCHFLWLKLQRA